MTSFYVFINYQKYKPSGVDDEYEEFIAYEDAKEMYDWAINPNKGKHRKGTIISLMQTEDDGETFDVLEQHEVV
ncbi:MAG: hypothetical protein EOM68_23360 [Spirochaetia bacterium]|nr:hypothetical protein [Spirochaetia bacterium]